MGTPVDSYFMYSDPVGQPHKLFPYVGTLTFSTPILGVMVKQSTLDATDTPDGDPATGYKIGPGDGLEDNGDQVELEGTSTTSRWISVRRMTSTPSGSSRRRRAEYRSGSRWCRWWRSGRWCWWWYPAPTIQGYTEVASDGGLFDFGSPFYVSMGGQPRSVTRPMVERRRRSPDTLAIGRSLRTAAFSPSVTPGSTGQRAERT